MPGETYYVPTDAGGLQRCGDLTLGWSLPKRLADGSFSPGELVQPDEGSPVVLRDLDGLLDDLGERIFLAEAVESKGARLLAETSWDLHEAARFALDCAEHVVADPAALRLRSGPSLADVFAAARRHLDRDEAKEGDGLVERMSRIALARRLRRLGRDVADVALSITVADERDDLEALDDPSWSAAAAAREAVLAATEAIRHDAFPRLFELANRRYEDEAPSADRPTEAFSTPWGNFSLGSGAGAVPAWVAAQEAAERAREAVAEAAGPQAAAGERSWQRDRLRAALALA